MNRCLGTASAAMLPLAAVLVMTSPAQAQMESREAISLQNQILELRHELQIIEAERGGAQPNYVQPVYPPPASGGGAETASQLLTRVASLEEQVRQLRGRVDELENGLQRATADLSKQIEDLKFQTQNPQARSGLPAGGALTGPPAVAQGAGAAVAPPSAGAAIAGVQPTAKGTAPAGPRTPEVALQEGYAALARRDYATAERTAQEVLSKRASPRGYDAQFLLAQSLAGQHQWSRAAIAYDDAYARAPKGGHAEEALLGLANSLASINEKRASCDTLTKLHAEFPKPRAELRDQITAAAQRAGCRA